MLPDEREVYALLGLLAKLSAGATVFSPEEKALMRRMREHREEVLAGLYGVSRDAIARNDRGRAKIDAIIRAVERICAVDGTLVN
jgi:hypothetical protein